MRRTIVVLCAVAVALGTGSLPLAGAGPEGGSEYPYGVAAADVSRKTAYLWTQNASATTLAASWTVDPTFTTGVKARVVPVPPTADGTALLQVNRLNTNTRYYFKFRNPATSAESPVGTFKTAPGTNAAVDVTFAYSGDQDGTINLETGEPAFNEFETFGQIVTNNPDFYVNLGDTIYADSQFRPEPANELPEYRQAHKDNIAYPTWMALRAATSIYSMWDDHEVQNDFDSETVDPQMLADGRQAFMEYEVVPAWDPTVGFYRHFRWGAEVEIFMLDERSFRTTRADKLDRDGDQVPDCNNPVTGAADLAPTLSQFWRDFFGSQIPGSGLDQPVPAQCTADLEASDRTMLGAAQRTQFLADLSASTARFKLVMNEDPIQLFFALPYDRWEGYRWERNAVLQYIDDHDIPGVTWLTTDIHAYFAHGVTFNTDTPGPGTPVEGMWDYTVGPVATFNFRAEVNAQVGDDTATKIRLFLLAVNGNTCANLGGAPPTPGAPYYGYGLVHVDAATHTLTVKPYDYAGVPMAGNGVIGGGGHEDEARDKQCYDYTLTIP